MVFNVILVALIVLVVFEIFKETPNKGLIYLALADPQESFKKPLFKNEEQPSFWKRYSAHFGEVSTL